MNDAAKEAAKTQCNQLHRAVVRLEENGEYGSRRWYQTKDRLAVALRQYSNAGATHLEMYNVCNV